MIDYIGAFLQVRSDTYNQVSFYYLLPFNELSVKKILIFCVELELYCNYYSRSTIKNAFEQIDNRK